MSEFDSDQVLSIEKATEILNGLNWDDTDLASGAKKFSWDVDSDDEDSENPLEPADTLRNQVDTQSEAAAEKSEFVDSESSTSSPRKNAKTVVISDENVGVDFVDASMAFKRMDESRNEEIMTVSNSSVTLEISMSMLEQWKQHLDDFTAGQVADSSNNSAESESKSSEEKPVTRMPS